MSSVKSTFILHSSSLGRRWASWLLIALTLISVSACDRFRELVISDDAKRQLAFPVTTDEAAVRKVLSASIKNDGQRQDFDDEFVHRVQVRSRRCTDGLPINALTRPAALRLKASDPDCTDADSDFSAWLAQQRVVQLLGQPPVHVRVPLDELHQVARARSRRFADMVFAADADIAVLTDDVGNYVVLRPSSGKEVRRIEALDLGDRAPLLSPNGRVVALPLDADRWRIVDIETGERLWVTSGLYRLLGWLPDVGALVAVDPTDDSGLLVDLVRGTRRPHRFVPTGVARAWPDPASLTDLLLWLQGRVVTVRHERTGAGVAVRELNGVGLGELARKDGPSPIKLLNRWWVGHAEYNELGLIDMHAVNPQISRYPLGTEWFGPVALDDHRAVILLNPLNAGSPNLVVLDLAARTAQVLQLPVKNMRLSGHLGRVGMMLSDDNSIWYGDVLSGLPPIGAQVPLDDWLLQRRSP